MSNFQKFMKFETSTALATFSKNMTSYVNRDSLSVKCDCYTHHNGEGCQDSHKNTGHIVKPTHFGFRLKMNDHKTGFMIYNPELYHKSGQRLGAGYWRNTTCDCDIHDDTTNEKVANMHFCLDNKGAVHNLQLEHEHDNYVHSHEYIDAPHDVDSISSVCPAGRECSGNEGTAGCLIIDDNKTPTKYCCTSFDSSGNCKDASAVCLDTSSSVTGTSICLQEHDPSFTKCTPKPKPKPKPQLFGNWYYGVGSVCNNTETDGLAAHKSLTAGPACTINFDKYLEVLNQNTAQKARNDTLGIEKVVRNSYFYLGTGYYEAKWTADSGGYITWECVDCDQNDIKNTVNKTDLIASGVPAASDGDYYGWNILNFGGWGCCGQDTGKGCKAPMGTDPEPPWNWIQNIGYETMCNSKGGASASTCNYKDLNGTGTDADIAAVAPSSTGPNAVWNTNVIGWFDSDIHAEDIKKKGFNAVSFDLEGIQDNLGGFANLLQKYQEAGLKTIITIPGNGITKEHGGMDWLTSGVKQYTDYICLMYYALIGDTICKSAGGGFDGIKTSLNDKWTGDNSTYKFLPEQIILGLSFGIGTPTQDLNKFFGETGIWGTQPGQAFGGVSRWAEQGGHINWGWKNTDGTIHNGAKGKVCDGAPKPPPPKKNCANSPDKCCTGTKNCSDDFTCELVCGDEASSIDCTTCTTQCDTVDPWAMQCNNYTPPEKNQSRHHSALRY